MKFAVWAKRLTAPVNMASIFDISAVENDLLGDGETVDCKGLNASSHTFDAGDKNGHLLDDMPAGTNVHGARSMVVDGSLNGMPNNPCRLQVTGDLLVKGNLFHAQVKCANLYVDGDIQDSRVTTTGDVYIGGELMQTHMVLGDYVDRKNTIDNIYRDFARKREERESLDRQIRQEEKRVDRSCKATLVPLNFNVSRIISHENNQVRINLTSFYSSLGDLSEARRKTALLEFFAKGIVGYLARANRKYISDNPAREKVFLQLLKHLRELFLLVAERDFIVLRQESDGQQMDEIADKVRNQHQNLFIEGGIHPDSSLRFMLPNVATGDDDEYVFTDKAASCRIERSADDAMLNVTLQDTEGNGNVHCIPSSDLEEARLSTTLGTVVWDSVTGN